MAAVRSLAGISVVIPAAGVGSRMASAVPKQYQMLDERTVLEATLSRFLSLKPDYVVVVVSARDDQYLNIPGVSSCTIVTGGAERSDSVLAGLNALSLVAQQWVMVHDAVRPCVRPDDILHLVECVEESDVGGLLAVPVIDTVKAESEGEAVLTVDRSNLWHAQTPQMFRYGVLVEALRQAGTGGEGATDEAAAVERTGLRPVLVEGHRDNIKITEPGDIELARFFIRSGA